MPAGPIFGCPSNNAYAFDTDHDFYGKSNYSFAMYSMGSTTDYHRTVYGWDFLSHVTLSSGTKPRCQLQTLAKVPAPSDIVWMADSASNRNWEGGAPAAAGRMVAAFNPLETSWHSGRIHLGHDGLANTLFYDGHVSLLGQDQLHETQSAICVFFDDDMTPIDLTAVMCLRGIWITALRGEIRPEGGSGACAAKMTQNDVISYGSGISGGV